MVGLSFCFLLCLLAQSKQYRELLVISFPQPKQNLLLSL
nr:MAG TPA: hypothetical protein [Caudoviricetes sp.]